MAVADGHGSGRETLIREIRARHPGFVEAVIADARVTARYRGERGEFGSTFDAVIQVLRLCWQSDSYLAQLLYRAKARLQALGVPLLPRLFNRLAIITSQLVIGDPVVVQPGIYVMHGQVVIDGITEIGRGVTIAPFVTIGLRAGDVIGPKVADHVQIGTGAKLLGRIEVGEGARIGANAVVIGDVPPGATAVGAPAAALGAEAPSAP